MFCTSCAAPITHDLVGCPRCGASDSWRSTSNPAETPVARPRLRRFLQVIPLTAAFLILAAATLALVIEDRANADKYMRAVVAEAEGDLRGALALYRKAGGYSGAAEGAKSVERRLDPYRENYRAGATALEANDFQTAISLLLPIAQELPNFEHVLVLLEQARAGLESDLRAAALSAVSRGDWLAAEQHLTALIAIDPEDGAVASQLLTLQREQALLTYGSGQELFIASPAGDTPQLLVDTVRVSWPAWSPDRRQIAFVAPSGEATMTQRALYVVNVDGSGLRRVADGPARWRAPVWSPDGTMIAFEVDGTTGENPSGRSTVMLASLRTGEVRDIVPPELPNGSSPTWSPDSDRIAFVVRAGTSVQADIPAPVDVLRIDGSDVFVWHASTGRTHSAAGGTIPEPWRLAWSPASEEILVYSRADGTSFRQGSIYMLNALSGESRLIDDKNIDVSMPVWAPDGRHFAYVIRTGWVQIFGPGNRIISVTSTVDLTGVVTWAPSSDRLLALGSSFQGQSLHVDVGETGGTGQPIPLSYDESGGDSAPAQWSPLHPARAARPASVSGSALDHPAPDR